MTPTQLVAAERAANQRNQALGTLVTIAREIGARRLREAIIEWLNQAQPPEQPPMAPQEPSFSQDERAEQAKRRAEVDRERLAKMGKKCPAKGRKKVLIKRAKVWDAIHEMMEEG